MAAHLELSDVQAVQRSAEKLADNVQSRFGESASFAQRSNELLEILKQPDHMERIAGLLEGDISATSARIEKLWAQIEKLKSEIERTSPEIRQEGEIEKEILSSLEATYAAAVQRMKEPTMKARISELGLDVELSDDASIALLQRNTETSLAQLEDAIRYINNEINDEQLLLARQERTVDELRVILDALRDATERQIKHTHEKGTENDVTETLDEINADKEKLVSQLRSFLSDHYPRPPGKTKKQNVGLRRTLQHLINNSFMDGDDRFIDIDDLWQPYQELLLRSGIAIKHPSEDKWRLEAYHM